MGFWIIRHAEIKLIKKRRSCDADIMETVFTPERLTSANRLQEKSVSHALVQHIKRCLTVEHDQLIVDS